MKHIRTILVLIALFTVGNLQAQNASKLNGKSFTVVVKDAANGGQELIEQLNFNNNSFTSETFSKQGFQSSKFIEKTGGDATNFEATIRSNDGSRLYRGKMEGAYLDGTVIITDAKGVETTYAFRGMTTEQWQKTMDMKSGKQ